MNAKNRLWRMTQSVYTRFDGWRYQGLFILLTTCAMLSVLVVDWDTTPTEPLAAGDVATQTVTAPYRFSYQDTESRALEEQRVSDEVAPVFIHQTSLSEDLVERLGTAFAAARTRQSDPKLARRAFQDALALELADEDIAALREAQFSAAVERRAVELLVSAMQHRIVADRISLPDDGRAITVLTTSNGQYIEHPDVAVQSLRTPGEVRERLRLEHLSMPRGGDVREALDASATVAQGLVRTNVFFDPIRTADLRDAAAAAVGEHAVVYERGETLFRTGDRLTSTQARAYSALQDTRSPHTGSRQLGIIFAFLLLSFGVVYSWSQTLSSRFHSRARHTLTAASLILATAVAARLLVSGAEGLAHFVGFQAQAESVWFAIPVAGGAMLVRLTMGRAWTVIYTVSSATLCGLMMNLSGIPVLFFILSGYAGARLVSNARERVVIFRASLWVALFNATLVLLFHFLQVFLMEGSVSLATQMRPLWSMLFAGIGGAGSVFVVLGALPALEVAGFVTDYRLLELANLNHPLLKQLMLRAPGTYHHSLVVGSLAEAGCDAISAKAVRARVASYFHDVGKSVNPKYFVENQRDGRNRHEGLDPEASAKFIISHVADGARLLKEHGLPDPIIEILVSHHGTGLLQYFYNEARRRASDGETVEIATFRYPGPKPSTREAGIVMLADKVEAATRTIKHPTEHNIRRMIDRIIASVIEDGQFTNCPLTMEEIDKSRRAFVTVLMGIYHHRVEYPSTADITRERPTRAAPSIDITTLEMEGLVQEATDPGSPVDYESLEHLPRRR